MIKSLPLIFSLLFTNYLIGEDWNCVSKDALLQELTCTSNEGKVFSFESSQEHTGTNYEINEDIQLDIKSFIESIGPDKSIKASTPAGDFLKGMTLKNGLIKGSVMYANGDTYEGNMLGALRHGKGIYRTNKYIYDGDFVEGSFTGYGSISSLDSNRVRTGNFLNGYAEGFIDEDIQSFIDEDGIETTIVYSGQAKDGFYHGIGKLTVKKIDEFVGIGIAIDETDFGFYVYRIIEGSPADVSEKIEVGDYIQSIKNRGKPKVLAEYMDLEELTNLIAGKKGRTIDLELVRFDENDNPSSFTVTLKRDTIVDTYDYVYEGRFQDGLKSGYGKETTGDGRSYEGTFKNNIYEGFGKRTWGEGNIFLGSYKEGVCEGTGIQLNQNYDIVYYGQFHDCLAHGQGGSVFHHSDGKKTIKSGEFFENQLDGYGEAYYPNGMSYKGNWKKDLWNGYGEVYEAELKRTISGIYEDGSLKDGRGTLTTDTYKYSGLFKDGLMHGKGKQYSRIFTDSGSIWSEEEYVVMKEGKVVGYYEPEEAPQEARVALVIGNGAYVSSRLENSVNDSVGIMKTLQNKGFKVIHKQDLNEKDFKQAIWDFEELVKSYTGKVTALFFYAGHAVQIDGDNYLIPVDSKMNQQRDIELGSVNAQTIINSLSNSTEGVKILIMDACRNNPFKSYSRDISGGLAQMSAPIGTFIAYSTAPGEIALDGSASGYGIYTGNLINALNTPDLTIEQVFKRTRMDVAGMTNGQQIPWESSSLIGDFYFFKNN
jgi:hypothetical protein